MRDPLKEYVDDHRAELDVAVPSDKLWTNIEAAMIVAIPSAGITSGISWLKYFAFGLSSVAAAAIVYTSLNSSSAQPVQTNPAPVAANTVLANEPPITSVAPATEFILMNTAAALPAPAPENISAVAFSSEPVQADSLPQQTERVNAAAAMTPGDSLFTGIRRVEMVSTSSNITVLGTNGNELSVLHKDVENAKLRLEYTRTDTLLRISATIEDNGRKLVRKNKCISINVGTTASPELTLNVPAGVSVVIQNTYGDTKISSISGPVCEVRSSSGDVVLSSITASTNVVTSYGDLTASDITGNLTARLSSGSAVVNQVNGNVDVVSTYGDQVHSDINGNLKAHGSSGHITVTNLRGDMTANTTYGDIHVTDFKGSARLTSSSGSIVGEKVELTASSTFATTYGNVSMTLVNPLQALSFELSTTYGDILVDKNGEQFHDESRLNLTRGNILIKATSSSGDQVYR
jgi:DUF4097 and DUF4098 domain-containing protein YvlB